MNKNRKKHRRPEKWRTVFTIRELLRKIENGKYLPIDMSRKNYKLKISEGVLNYTSYEVFHRGEIFVIKCQVRRNGPKVTEYPYSIKQKKND